MYDHNFLLPHDKLGLREKKYIFNKILRTLRRYVSLGEHTDGTVTEIESRDTTFLKDDFPMRNEVNQDSTFYLMDEFSSSVKLSDGTEEPIKNLDYSGSDLLRGKIDLGLYRQ